MNTTTTLITQGSEQIVIIPEAFHLAAEQVEIKQLGNGIYIGPVGDSRWPQGYLESIEITDKQFARPDQGVLPPSRNLEDHSA